MKCLFIFLDYLRGCLERKHTAAVVAVERRQAPRKEQRRWGAELCAPLLWAELRVWLVFRPPRPAVLPSLHLRNANLLNEIVGDMVKGKHQQPLSWGKGVDHPSRCLLSVGSRCLWTSVCHWDPSQRPPPRHSSLARHSPGSPAPHTAGHLASVGIMSQVL